MKEFYNLKVKVFKENKGDKQVSFFSLKMFKKPQQSQQVWQTS